MEFIANQKRKLSKLALYNFKNLSYSKLQKLLRNKDVKVNGKRIKEDVMLEVGDKVEIYYNAPIEVGYTVLFQDENVLVVNKKQNYTSEEIYESILLEKENAGFIHRLDRNTSGVMMFSLNEIAEKELLNGFKTRTFEKYYTATVYGKMPKKADILTAYLLKDKDTSTVKIFDKKVKDSVLIKTGYEVLEEREDTSVIKVRLYTGKTHQIRAHLAHVGNFIVGDGKYGENAVNKRLKADRQMLTASEIILSFEKTSPLYYLNGKSFKVE